MGSSFKNTQNQNQSYSLQSKQTVEAADWKSSRNQRRVEERGRRLNGDQFSSSAAAADVATHRQPEFGRAFKAAELQGVPERRNPAAANSSNAEYIAKQVAAEGVGSQKQPYVAAPANGKELWQQTTNSSKRERVQHSDKTAADAHLLSSAKTHSSLPHSYKERHQGVAPSAVGTVLSQKVQGSTLAAGAVRQRRYDNERYSSEIETMEERLLEIQQQKRKTEEVLQAEIESLEEALDHCERRLKLVSESKAEELHLAQDRSSQEQRILLHRLNDTQEERRQQQVI